MYKICREMYDDGVGLPFQSQPDLIGDKLVGGLLSLSLDYCFVLEDEDGICGYALGTVDVTPSLRSVKFPGFPSCKKSIPSQMVTKSSLKLRK